MKSVFYRCDGLYYQVTAILEDGGIDEPSPTILHYLYDHPDECVIGIDDGKVIMARVRDRGVKMIPVGVDISTE